MGQKFVSPQNLYVEALISGEMVFGEGVVRVWLGHGGGPLRMGLAVLNKKRNINER